MFVNQILKACVVQQKLRQYLFQYFHAIAKVGKVAQHIVISGDVLVLGD
jgi:hypothetical protein